ncbi:MAG: amidohydrolase [Deltaproteobacteria bacterium]|nr:amidohydrolase [Deltaproteobacteria bacterium]
MAADGKQARLIERLDAIEAAGNRPIEAPGVATGPRALLVGGTVLTAEGHRYSPGWVLIDGGRIRGVGEGEPPADERAARVDVSGRFVTPGLIDTHSHLGVYPSPSARAHGDGNEATAPGTAGVWAEHSFWPQDPGLERAVAGGVTTLQALPGSANLIGGRGVTLHLAPQRGSRAMRFPGAPVGVKMACGENPKRVYGERKQAPSTRMGNTRAFRELFLKARDASQKLAKADDEDALPRDLDSESLIAVLEGRALVQVHCYRADDMLGVLQVADEMGFEVRSFHHAVEAYKIRDILAARHVSVSTWADWWGFKMEAYDAIPENAALVDEAGARAVIHSDSARGIQRLNQEAGKAMAAGRRAGVDLSEDDALRWITANAAWTLGIEDQVGTLETGKRADIVVWDADPLSVYASADLVFIDGVLRYDRSRPEPPWSDFELGQDVQP